jgi:hypothetical protein
MTELRRICANCKHHTPMEPDPDEYGLVHGLWCNADPYPFTPVDFLDTCEKFEPQQREAQP